MESKAQKASREQWRRAASAVVAATRRDNDLTQAQLAKKLGWSRESLARIETGNRKLELSDFIVIAYALGVAPDVLFGRVLHWMRGK